MADNIIKVNVTANKTQRVTVSSANVGTEITASSDTGKFWAQNAKNWAVSENIVDGEDYSSKYYANKSKGYAQNAESFEAASRETYNNIVTKSDNAITEIEELKEISEQEISIAVADGLTEINKKKNTAISDLEFVSEGEKEEIKDLANLIKENAQDIANRTSFAMFDTILKDHVLTYEESKGLALQGTWVYKTAIAGSRYGYPDFYAKCLEEYNQATDTETVNGKTVKVHSNGHKFYDIADKTGIDEFFSTMGSAWFYGIDTVNESIFLPRNNYYSLSLNKDVANVHSRTGSTVDVSTVEMMPYYSTSSGALVTGSDAGVVYPGIDSGGRIDRIGNDDTGSHSSYTMGHSLYVDSADIVATNTDYYLYICVGNTVSDTSWVDVVTQVEGGVKDLEDKTNEGIEVLSNASNALRQTQITNCLLEVPQNIKLELNNGTLTLKAGSKVIVPNGVGVFEEYVTPSDLTLDGRGSSNAEAMIFYANSGLYYENINTCISGTTPLATGINTIYNTSDNTIKRYSNNSLTVSNISLPLCIVTRNAGAFTSIKQVFNGLGYIGSTRWIDKGVKFLAPNGRNEDGTLNNYECVVPKLTLRTRTDSWSGKTLLAYYFDGNSADWTYDFFTESDVEPTPTASTWRWFNTKENKIYYTSDSGATWKTHVAPIAILGDNSFTSGVITSLQPKLPFRAVDYNDKSEIVSWSMPDYSAGVSISNKVNFTAPTDGYIVVSGYSSTSSNSNFYINGVVIASLTYNINTYSHNVSSFLVNKGDIFKVSYSSTLTIGTFYPLKGAK